MPSASRSIAAPVSSVVLRALGERLGRGVEVGLVDRDPSLARTDERARFLGESRDVGGR